MSDYTIRNPKAPARFLCDDAPWGLTDTLGFTALSSAVGWFAGMILTLLADAVFIGGTGLGSEENGYHLTEFETFVVGPAFVVAAIVVWFAFYAQILPRVFPELEFTSHVHRQIYQDYMALNDHQRQVAKSAYTAASQTREITYGHPAYDVWRDTYDALKELEKKENAHDVSAYIQDARETLNGLKQELSLHDSE